MNTRRILLFVCAAIVFAPGGMAAQRPSASTGEMVKSYLEVQAALASDKFADVAAPAKALAEKATALGQAGADVAKAAAAVGAAADIAAAREAFGPLSNAMIARVKADGSADAALRLGYCPMVKRSWLQREGQVRNPYYGAAMPTCGELKEVR
ncbi:MAG: DUF3347 domain-containing protein [Vicinamibacterales bacterium]